MSGPGPAMPVNAPPLSPPLLSLWSMGIKPTAEEAADERWGNGIAFYPESCGGDVDTHATGCAELGQVVSPTKPVPVPRETIDFDAFTIVGVEQCSTFSRRNVDEYRARAFRALDACWVREFEREFWLGTIVPGNPHLSSGAEVDDLTSATSLDVAEGVATLEETLADRLCGGGGMIHMSRRAFSLISDTELVQIPGGDPAGGVAMTKLGTLIVPGAGYPGNAPDGSHSNNTEYLYATGPVKVFRGQNRLVPGDLSEALNRRTNTIAYYAELAAAYAWDPCCLLGIEVEVPGGGGS